MNKYKVLNVFLFLLFMLTATSNAQLKLDVEPAFEKFSKIPNVRDCTISTHNNEVYFTVQSPNQDISRIAFIKKKDNLWTDSELATFSNKFIDLEPSFSPNGFRLYFVSNRPLKNTNEEPKDFDIWYVERTDLNSEWSQPINLGEPINTEHDEFYPSIVENNNLYFTSQKNSKTKDDIYISIWNGTKYMQPVRLSDSINTNGYEFNSFVALDESFIIYSGYNRKDGFGSGDLYISFRKKDFTWSASKNLGRKINSKFLDCSPFVYMKSKILFFTSKRSMITNKVFDSFKDFENEITKYENGYSRIYKVSLKNILKSK